MRTFNPDQLPKPNNWESFSPPSEPLDIEIGCGVGLHPLIRGRENPHRFLVAIEHSRTRFFKFQRRFENHQSPSNILPVHADGVNWVSHFVKPSSVENYFFLYPNPYPKKGDLNKRWHGMPFMAKVIETLVPGGKIHLRTNEEFYKEEAKHYLSDCWNLNLLEEETVQEGLTHFERKYLERGQSCYKLVFQKNY